MSHSDTKVSHSEASLRAEESQLVGEILRCALDDNAPIQEGLRIVWL